MDNNKIKLNITGMTCGGCAAMVKTALGTVPNVSEVEVDLPTNTATVTTTGTPPALEALIATVRQAGYDATSSN